MSSMIEICNMSLGYLGEPPIADLNERRPAAEYCKLYFPIARDMALRDHPWNFAQAREKLTPVALPTEWQSRYAFAYAKPPKCLNLHFMLDRRGCKSVHFELADTRDRTIVLCGLDKAVGHFTRRVEDTERFDPNFVQALTRKLQALVVTPLLKNNIQLVQEAETLYQRELEEARLQDAREGRRFQDASTVWDGGHDLWGDIVQRECCSGVLR